MTSWDEVFADRYDEWSAHMTADVPFYVELARDTGGPLVELAIGSGRVAIPVAAGLELETLHGGFAGEPFTEDSREYVFVTRRPMR